MDRIDEILFLYEDDRVEMNKGGKVDFRNTKKFASQFEKPLSKKDLKTFNDYKKTFPNSTKQQLASAKSRIRQGVIKPGQYTPKKPPITKEQFKDEYKKFQKSKNNMGLDSEFAEYLNKNYKSNKGLEFNTKNIQRQRKTYGLKTKVKTVPPSVQARFNKINKILPDLVKDLNSKEKFVTREQLSSMVEKKLNLPAKYDKFGYKISQLDLDNYPIVRTLDKVPDKIEKTLKNMLLEDKPLNDFFLDALQKRTGLDQRTINLGLKNSPRYRSIADKGAYDLRFRFNNNNNHGFLKELSFSDQLKKGISMREGQPVFVKMGEAKRYGASPKNKVMEFAMRNWNANQGRGAVKFFNKKTGQPITWEYGKKLPYKEVSFTHRGKIFNAQKLGDIDVVKKFFPEVYKNQTAINNLGRQIIDSPFKKGTQIAVKDLIKEIQINAYEWSPRTGTLDVLHGPKGIKLEPFTNLSFNTRDINQLELGLSKGFKSGNLSKSQLDDTIKLIRKAAPSDPQSIISRQLGLAQKFQKGKLGAFTDMSDEIRALAESPGKTKLADIQKAIGQIDEIKKGVSQLKGAQLGTFCKAMSKAGFATGGNVTASCLKAIDDNPARAISAAAKISKPTGTLKNVVSLSKTLAKGTGYALLGELAIAGPIALYQYGKGESKERMIGDATYGLAGQTIDDEKKEFMGKEGFKAHKLVDDLGQLDNLTTEFQDSETIMMPEDEELNIQQMNKKEKEIAEGLKSYEAEDGSFDKEKFDRDFDTGSAGLKNLEDVKGFRRDVRRDEDYDVFEEVAAAKGGLISLKPRKPEALPPESGPNPQGLENLKYYVTNT